MAKGARSTTSLCLLLLLCSASLSQAAPATPTTDTPTTPTTPTTPVVTVAATPAPTVAATTAPTTAATKAPAATPAATTAPTTAATKAPAPTPKPTVAPIILAPPPPAVITTPKTDTPPAPAAANEDVTPVPPGAPALAVAVRGVVRVIGTGVTPFTPDKQSVLIMAVATVMTTVSSDRIRVVLVADAYKLRKRELLATALQNVADVTVEINAGNLANVNPVETEFKGIFSGPLATAMQKQGQSSWATTLLSTEVGTPSSTTFPKICKSKLGSLCLDGSGLSPTGAKAIIAVGSILIIGVIALVGVLYDIRARSGKSGECEYATDSAQSTPVKGETPTSGRAVPMTANAFNGHAAPTPSMKGAKF